MGKNIPAPLFSLIVPDVATWAQVLYQDFAQVLSLNMHL